MRTFPNSIVVFSLVTLGSLGCQGCSGKPETTGLAVAFAFEGAPVDYAAGFTGFVAFDEGNGPILPIRRAKMYHKGFMDRPDTIIRVQDPVFGVEKGVEIRFSPLPNLRTIYVGSKKLRAQEWTVQAFPIRDLGNSPPGRYIIPVARLGPDKPQIDSNLHAAVVGALKKCDQESTKLQDQEP